MSLNVLRWLDQHFEELFLTLFLVLLTCLMTVNVVLRYILGSGLNWSEAICRYALVYSTFFTIAHWVRRSSDIAVDAVLMVLPETVKTVLHYVVRIIIIVFFALLFRASFSVLSGVDASGMKDGTLGFPMTYIYVACCIGFGDALLRSVQVLILDIMAAKNKTEA